MVVPVMRVTGTTPAPSASRSSGRSAPPPPSQHPRWNASAMAPRFSSLKGVLLPPLCNRSSVNSTVRASGFHDRSP
ncbi:hypothetical protein ACQEV4_21565 [Streptomyces shenzhenensis]|uniref:hypothetical protein n=1 Tax=Streptomyces shenzhenensis TaxID=943815 RepID=UPI003D8E63AA